MGQTKDRSVVRDIDTWGRSGAPVLKGQLAGAPERVAVRQNFVLDAMLSGFRTKQITTLWNKKCIDEGEVEYQVHESVIRRDKKELYEALVEDRQERIDALREVMHLRLNSYLTRLDSQIKAGNIRAIGQALKINQQIAAMYGIGSHSVIEQNTTNILLLTPEERQQRVLALLAKAETREAEAEYVDADVQIDGE